MATRLKASGRRTILVLVGALLFFCLELILEQWLFDNDRIVDILGAATGVLAVLLSRSAIINAHLYKTLRQNSEELEKRVAEIAHEFQTPISILKANLALLSENVTSRSTRLEKSRRLNALYTADTTLDRLSRLVVSLLDAAKLNFSKEKLLAQIVDVRHLLSDARDDCEILAEDKNIAISFSCELVFVAGDKDKLREVLLNLLSNALRHTPAKGLIMIAGRRDGKSVEIVVADNGEGISPEALPKIFERFYRIDQRGAAGAGNAPGNGIGLYLCRQIIEAHGGTIAAESTLGQGSRFIIRLPAKNVALL